MSYKGLSKTAYTYSKNCESSKLINRRNKYNGT